MRRIVPDPDGTGPSGSGGGGLLALVATLLISTVVYVVGAVLGAW